MNYTLNLENCGDSIAVIKTKKTTKFPTVSIGECFNKGDEELKLKDKDDYFQPITRGNRLCSFITGASGSGKSFYILNYANEYKKMYPKRDIILFSGLDKDAGAVDQIKGLIRIKIDDEFLNEDLKIEDFLNGQLGCLLIFDDIDGISDKKVKSKIWDYLNLYLTTGRHHNVEILVSMHLPTNRSETRLILNECGNIVFFPMTVGNKINYLLKEYLGLTTLQIKKIMKTESRSICICKTYPKTVITEKECFILRPDK